jgi:hypothetical protein
VGGELSYPPKGWTKERMEEKFRWLVEPTAGSEKTSALIDLVWHFDELPGPQELISLAIDT